MLVVVAAFAEKLHRLGSDDMQQLAVQLQLAVLDDHENIVSLYAGGSEALFLAA